ncbi:ATP-dependent endonuclease, partial [Listeria monocytogenes]|nr:ATP-dependent endonuclease [Listeria monocytogenes]
KTTRFTYLESTNFFEKISGYDTLRLILCKKAILVEGDSDELILQRAYMDSNDGRLPVEDEVEIISVGTSFLRFLEIARNLKISVKVVTDNDGDIIALEKKYEDYIGVNKKKNIEICYDEHVYTGKLTIGKEGNKKDFNYNTLEPLMLKANSLQAFNDIFGKAYSTEDELHKYMKQNKTDCALKIFSSTTNVEYPEYINRAIL